MAARSPPTPAKKKPAKVPPVPPHKRQFGHSAAATNILEEGDYESIDTQLIHERISDSHQKNVKETSFGLVQPALDQSGQFRHAPPLKSKPHQREIDEMEIRETVPSEPAIKPQQFHSEITPYEDKV